MTQLLEYIINKLGKPYKDLEFLLKCFSEVLVENNEDQLSLMLPWISDREIKIDDNNRGRILQLYSICFQLLNLAEVNSAVQNRRKKIEDYGVDSINGLWGWVLSDLKKNGIKENELLDNLSQICIEPVLTAHPTEAKRPVILGLYRELYLLLVKRENSMYNSLEHEEIRQDIKNILHRLWYIGEIYLQKPAVESELENMLHYFYKVFPDVIHYHDNKFKQAWEKTGFNKDILTDSGQFPGISFGNWVGGDRDGHPLVTAQVTEYTLKTFRLYALRLVNNLLEELSEKLGIYCDESSLMPEFSNRMAELKGKLTELLPNTSFEPYKNYIQYIKSKLPIVEQGEGGIGLLDNEWCYHNSEELINDLCLLKKALLYIGAVSLAQTDVQKIIRHLQVFGFHLAHIDIRQNSEYYEKALLDIIKTSLPSEYIELVKNKPDFNRFILGEMNNNRPFINRINNLTSDQAREVIRTFQALGKHIRNYSERALGSLIVSMTRSEYDLFTVYLFMREAGLSHYSDKGLVCPLMVVPLFETIEDLVESPRILDKFLSHPVTKNCLKYIQQQKNWSKPVQEVMIGYSDSNKDGGIIASSWYLSYAQMRLSETGKKHGVDIRFFHGKGGTISRGAGPVHWFLRSLPVGTLNGLIRVTEQGETIERKYANKVNGAYNLELLVAGVTHQTVLNNLKIRKEDDDLIELFTFLADESLKVFKAFTNHPSFIKYYEEGTPIDAIESSKIGSRPARRTGKRSLADLRAIPWVFSWTQSRMQVSGWYGVGSTLRKMKSEYEDKYNHLKKLVKTNNYVRYVLTNIDTSLAATDEDIILLYSSLVSDIKIKDDITGLLLKELKLTREMMEELLGRPIEERRINHYYSTKLRAKALLPLHKEQVQLLKLWRKELQNGKTKYGNQLLNDLLRSINAIANALGTTG